MTDPKFGEIKFERRVFPRFVIHLPVSYALEDNAASGEGITNDASLGGLQIYVAEKFNLGDKVKIKLSLAEGKTVHTIQALARVVWIEENPSHDPKPYKMGLEFVDISAESLKHLKWFEQLWLNQAS